MSETTSNSTQVAAPESDLEEFKALLPTFFIRAVLFLPLAFFLWFVFKSPVVAASIKISAWIFSAWMPDIISDVHQQFEQMVYSVTVQVGTVPGLPTDRLLLEEQRVNALTYCYNLPILLGLVMATPLNWRLTFLQLGVGYLVLVPFQVFGVLGEVLSTLAFGAGPAVTTALATEGYAPVAASAGANAAAWMKSALSAHGLHLEAIAAWYQFGNLILPPISAAVIWILFNRRFIEALRYTEPAEPSDGPSEASHG